MGTRRLGRARFTCGYIQAVGFLRLNGTAEKRSKELHSLLRGTDSIGSWERSKLLGIALVARETHRAPIKMRLPLPPTFYRPGRAGWTIFEDHALFGKLIANRIPALEVFCFTGSSAFGNELLDLFWCQL